MYNALRPPTVYYISLGSSVEDHNLLCRDMAVTKLEEGKAWGIGGVKY